jgi:photosystem II stability/assembly factor-like uncharacterized protein
MMNETASRFRAPWIAILILCALPSLAAAAGRWRSITPEGAAAQSLAVSRGIDGTLYVRTRRGNLYASSDGGARWSLGGSVNGYVRDLVAPAGRSGLLYALSSFGLFRSIDGGRQWSLLTQEDFLSIRVAPSDPDVLYAAASGRGVLKSVDGGAHWTATSLPNASLAVEVDPGDARIVYSVDTGNVFRSDDGGATWVEIGEGLRGGEGFVNVSALVADPRQPATLYALRGPIGVSKSTDRGATWNLAWTGPAGFPFLRELAVDPVSGTVYAIDYDKGLFRSRDGGATWSQVLNRYGLSDLDVDARGRAYVVGRSGGIYSSEDGGSSWALSGQQGMRELGFIQVAADPHTPGLLFAVANPDPETSLAFSPQYLLRSTDGGATWSSPFGEPDVSPFVNDLAADPSRPGTWYLAISGGSLKTTDGGQTWTNASRGFRLPEFVYTLALAPSDPNTLYSIGWYSFPLANSSSLPVRVFRTTDGGERWFRSRLPGLDAQPNLLETLTVDPQDASIVYAGGPGFFKSTDGGVHWKKIGVGLRNYVLYLAADPFSSGTLYASVHALHGRRVVKSIDGGATWTPAATGLPAGASWVGRIVPDPAAPGTLYAATAKGVYVTRNGGALWTAMNDGLGEVPILSVAVDPLRPGILYAAGIDGLFEFATSP